MELPTALRDAVANALVFVRQHPQHELNPGYRQAIYAVYGPLDAPSTGGATPESQLLDVAGNRRRAVVSLMAAQRVLPYWKQAMSDSDMLDVLLADAQQLLHTQAGRQKAKEDAQAAWLYTDEVLATQLDLPRRVSAAAFAAVVALQTTLWGVAFFGEYANLSWSDYHLDSEAIDIARRDAASWAALSAANGRYFDEDADHAKRLEFWEWWLNEAVPQAWESVPE
jgi:hypothetical protein